MSKVQLCYLNFVKVVWTVRSPSHIATCTTSDRSSTTWVLILAWKSKLRTLFLLINIALALITRCYLLNVKINCQTASNVCKLSRSPRWESASKKMNINFFSDNLSTFQMFPWFSRLSAARSDLPMPKVLQRLTFKILTNCNWLKIFRIFKNYSPWWRWIVGDITAG